MTYEEIYLELSKLFSEDSRIHIEENYYYELHKYKSSYVNMSIIKTLHVDNYTHQNLHDWIFYHAYTEEEYKEKYENFLEDLRSEKLYTLIENTYEIL